MIASCLAEKTNLRRLMTCTTRKSPRGESASGEMRPLRRGSSQVTKNLVGGEGKTRPFQRNATASNRAITAPAVSLS